MSQWYTIFKRSHFLSSVLTEGLVSGHNSKWPQSDYCSWLFVENNIHSSFQFFLILLSGKKHLLLVYTSQRHLNWGPFLISHDCMVLLGRPQNGHKRSCMQCCFYWQSDTHIVYCSLTHQALNILSFEILLCKQKHSMCFGYGCPLSVLLFVCLVELL